MIFGIIDYIMYYNQFGRYSTKSLKEENGILASEDLLMDWDNIVGGIIIIHTRISFLSWLVMYVTNSVWSHTGIISGYKKILHATTAGTVEQSFDDLLNNKSHLLVYKVNLPKGELTEIVDTIKKSFLGMPYGWGKAFFFLPRSTFGYSKDFRFRLTLDFAFLMLSILYVLNFGLIVIAIIMFVYFVKVFYHILFCKPHSKILKSSTS